VTEREWRVARGYLEGASLLQLEDSGAVMARLGNHLCARHHVTPVEEQLARLRAVTVDDVHRVLVDHLADEPVLSAVGPIDEMRL
jgi:predicted Zn-dependent peptidase